MRSDRARMVAAAGTAGTGVAAGAAAYLLVGGLPGVLYAGGIVFAALFGTVAILASRTRLGPARERAAAPRPPLWRRKTHIIAGLELELASTGAELEEHRQALANLAAQLTREAEEARSNAQRLEARIRELETERDGLHELIAEERDRFEQTLDELGGGIGRHGNELAALERELEALISR